jgi:NADPH:quinone reductase
LRADALALLNGEPGTVLRDAFGGFGVGNQAVQLAAKAGAHVIATASSDEEKALVTSLGAESVVDYAGDVAAAVREIQPDGVDAVIHLAGDPQALLPALRHGGRLVSTLLGSPDQLPTDDHTVVGIYANPDAATLDRLAGHRTEGNTRVEIQDTFPLDQAQAAMEAFAGGTLGKVAITTV